LIWYSAVIFLLKSLSIAIIVLVFSLWSLWSFAVRIGSEGPIPYSVAPPKVPDNPEFLEEPSIKVMPQLK
jgi:hypothetical protein